MRVRLSLGALLFTLAWSSALFAQKAPPQAEWDKATADLTGSDAQLQTAAVQKVEGWVKGGWVSQDVWRKWLPALVKAGRQQEAYDLATLAICGRPGPEAVAILQEARMRAMLALGKNDEALAMAKAYYNVVEIKGTATAVDFVGTCLAKAHPEDGEIVRRFRNEQAAASVAGAATKPGNAGVPPAGAVAGDTPALSVLAAVKIDDAPFVEPLKTLAGKTKFADRMGYGNLLLVADHGEIVSPDTKTWVETGPTRWGTFTKYHMQLQDSATGTAFTTADSITEQWGHQWSINNVWSTTGAFTWLPGHAEDDVNYILPLFDADLYDVDADWAGAVPGWANSQLIYRFHQRWHVVISSVPSNLNTHYVEIRYQNPASRVDSFWPFSE